MGVRDILELNPEAPEAQHHETPPEQLRDGGRQWLDDSGKQGKVTLTAILKKEKMHLPLFFKVKCTFIYFQIRFCLYRCA